MRHRRPLSVSLILVSLPLIVQAAPVGRMVAHESIFLGNAGIGSNQAFANDYGLVGYGDDGRVAYGVSETSGANPARAVRTWNPSDLSTATSALPGLARAISTVVAPGGSAYALGPTSYAQYPAQDLYRANGATATALNAGIPSAAAAGAVYALSADATGIVYEATGNGSTYRYDIATGTKTTLFSAGGANDLYYQAVDVGVGPGGLAAALEFGYGSNNQAVNRRNADGTITRITSLVSGNTFNWDSLYGVGVHAVDAAGEVAFTAKTKGGGTGIFVGNGSGLLKTVAVEGDANFNGVFGTLASFGGAAQITLDGRVVFKANDKANQPGIYMWADGKTTKLAGLGDTFLDADNHPLVLSAIGSVSGSHPPLAFTINAFGDVLIGGTFTNTGNPIGDYSAYGMAVIPRPVPEPGTLAALALGGLGLLRRRRR